MPHDVIVPPSNRATKATSQNPSLLEALVKKGEALREVETDKVNVQIEATGDGVLQEVKALEGDLSGSTVVDYR